VLSQQETSASHEGIEDVLCSKTRLKILKLLIGSQLTPSEIANAVGISYLNAAAHLEALEAEGVLEHVMFGKRIRFFKYNELSPRAEAVQALIEVFRSCLRERQIAPEKKVSVAEVLQC